MSLYYRLVLANYCLVIFLQSNTKPHTFNAATRFFVASQLIFIFTAIMSVVLWLIAQAGYRFHEFVLCILLFAIWAIATPSYKTYEAKMKNAGVFSEYGKLSFKQRLGYACVAAMVGVVSVAMFLSFMKLFFGGYSDLSQMPGRFGK